jgi:hypothetical protein
MIVRCRLTLATDPFFSIASFAYDRFVYDDMYLLILSEKPLITGTRIYYCSRNCSEKHRSSIESTSKGGLGDREAWESDPFASTYFLTFFSPQTFFSRAQDQRGKNSETQSGKKGELPIGQWVNFRVSNHEQTPYSDAHVCAPYNLTSKQVSHAKSLAIHRPSLHSSRLNQLCLRGTLPHIHPSMTKRELFLVKEEAQTCTSIGDVCHTRAGGKSDYWCIGSQC